MSDFYLNALNNYANANALQLKPTTVIGLNDVAQRDITGKTHLINAESAIVKAQSEVTVRQNAVGAVSVDLLDGGQIEFRIQKGSIKRLDHLYSKLVINNDTGANVQLLPIQLCVNYVQVFGQNGNDLLYQIQGSELWLDNMNFSYLEWTHLFPRLNSDSAYSTAGNVVANGATVNYYIPLLRLFNQANLCPSALSSELTIRIVFNPASINVVAGANPRVDDCYLLLRGHDEPEAITQKRMENYMTKSLTIPYLHPVRMSQTLTLAASSEYSIVLSALRGLCSSLTFTIRSSPITSANMGTYSSAVASFDIQNGSGESLTGHYRMQYDENKDIVYSEKFDNKFGDHSNFIMIPFAESPVHAFQTGSNHGFNTFTGFEKLSFTTSSALVPGAYQIDVYANMHTSATIEKGVLTTRKP